jgi:hypothetical protein
MSIFGISLLDNFGFDFITNFITEIKIITYNILDYLSNTQFYKYINKLFFNNEVTKQSSSKSGSMIESNKIETIRNDTKIGENSRNSKISE